MKQTRSLIGAIIIILGLSLLFNVDILRYLLPLLLIWLGWRIISGRGEHPQEMTASDSQESYIHRVLIFSGINQRLQTKDFKGGELVLIFGGGELDLRQTHITQSPVRLEIVAIFGGLKVWVPPTWKVSSEGVGIIGGYDNRATNSGSPEAELQIKGVAILGGVEIVN